MAEQHQNIEILPKKRLNKANIVIFLPVFGTGLTN